MFEQTIPAKSYVRYGDKVKQIDTIDLGFFIGLRTCLTDFIAHTEVQLQPGNVVVLYTDGLPKPAILMGCFTD